MIEISLTSDVTSNPQGSPDTPFSRGRKEFKVYDAIICPNIECEIHKRGISNAYRFKGTYRRKSDGRLITQFYCPRCGKSFSEATLEPTYRQRKPRINTPVRNYLMSGVSARRAAKLTGVDRKTIARRIPFFASMAMKAHWSRISREQKRRDLQTDEMETFEHTKYKPLSIPLVVDSKTREILDIDVACIPTA